MKITWFGHSCFRVETGESRILIDPFLTGNATFEKAEIPMHKVIEGITHVALTHGHEDHL
ncbi:MBL fold metallo-hydrolase, partial [Methyloceanibacter marginalis]|uniref:MBL fold metallo-hydrolase n=1 Tax=Methyloceanibacter marginalis TaxID=1774971 RepID=UPI00114CF693